MTRAFQTYTLHRRQFSKDQSDAVQMRLSTELTLGCASGVMFSRSLTETAWPRSGEVYRCRPEVPGPQALAI